MATIVVVDDEHFIVDLLIEVVTDAGHTPIAASNGRDALALAQQHKPALIISDVRMPIMDGIALLHALRADPHIAHTPLLLISAHVSRPAFPLDTLTTFAPKPLDLDIIEHALAHLS